MRDYAEILAGARPGPAFSNGTMWELWADRWCYADCVHWGDDDTAACPLWLVSFVDRKIPTEWAAADEHADLIGDYTCIEFRRPGDGPGPEPQPIPDPPDQGVLWPREPFQAVRMLTTEPQPVGVA